MRGYSMKRINLFFDIFGIAAMSAFVAYLLFVYHNNSQIFQWLVQITSNITDLVRKVYPKISLYEVELSSHGYEDRILLVTTAYSVCFAYSLITMLVKFSFFRRQLSLYLSAEKEMKGSFERFPVSIELSFAFGFIAAVYVVFFGSIDFDGEYRMGDRVHLFDSHLYRAPLFIGGFFGLFEHSIVLVVANNKFLLDRFLPNHTSQDK